MSPTDDPKKPVAIFPPAEPVPGSSRAEIAPARRKTSVHLGGRLLIDTPAEHPAWHAVYVALALTLVCLMCIWFVRCYWAPAHAGTDQNGYLVGGKMMADHWTSGFKPADPWEFVGRMWVSSGFNLFRKEQIFFPKYPIGLPFIYGLLYKIGGPTVGVAMCHLVSPICMTAGLFFTFLLMRMVVGSVGALLGMIAVGSAQVTLGLTVNPNSHASTFLCVTAGMFFLLRWWQSGALWRGMLAGFLIGFAATIRYTEGALVLPLILVALFNLRWKNAASWRQVVYIMLSWTIPVWILAIYNLRQIGTLTGYDPCNESTGFRWEYFQDNWETMLRQLMTNGLFFVFPFGVLGMFAMFRWNWKLASVLTAWIAPCLLIYTAYYWAPDGAWIGYVRFFLTILPALAICAVWVMIRGSDWLVARQESGMRRAKAAIIGVVLGTLIVGGVSYGLARTIDEEQIPEAAQAMDDRSADQIVKEYRWKFTAIGSGIGAGVGLMLAGCPWAIIIALGSAVGIFTSTRQMELESRNNVAFSLATNTIRKTVPSGSIVFGEERLFNHLQFAADYRLYATDVFNRTQLANAAANVKPDEPTGLQPDRVKKLWELVRKKSDNDLIEEQRNIMRGALDENKKVFFIFTRRGMDAVIKRFVPVKQYEVKTVMKWNEPEEKEPILRKRQPRGNMNRPFLNQRGEPTSWLIVEITRKPPVAPPAVQPATRPAATRPTTNPVK